MTALIQWIMPWSDTHARARITRKRAITPKLRWLIYTSDTSNFCTDTIIWKWKRGRERYRHLLKMKWDYISLYYNSLPEQILLSSVLGSFIWFSVTSDWVSDILKITFHNDVASLQSNVYFNTFHYYLLPISQFSLDIAICYRRADVTIWELILFFSYRRFLTRELRVYIYGSCYSLLSQHALSCWLLDNFIIIDDFESYTYS